MPPPLRAFAAFVAIAISALAADRLPYTATRAFAGLSFEQPIGIVSAPGDKEHVFILEKPGRILVLNATEPKPTPKVFLDLREKVGSDAIEQGVLALAFHPDWRRNRQIYIWYTYCHTRAFNTTREDRLSRFLLSEKDLTVVDPDSELQLIAQDDEAPNHNGGELLFGADGYLYLSLGDEGAANDSFANSQRIDKDFFAGILRLDVDKKPGNLAPNPHPAVRPGTYLVPADNPFVGATSFNGAPIDPKKIRTEFWAVGLRNPWRMSFDAQTGQLWCGDVGQDTHEEIDLIVRGGNYGWKVREGAFAFRGRAPATTTFVEPIWDYSHMEGQCIIGGLVYRGKRYPGLDGKYIFGDYTSGRVWALAPEGDRAVSNNRVQQIATVYSVTSFGRDPTNDDILLATLDGKIVRLVAASGK